MIDKMNHEDVSTDVKIDIMHVKIDYIMQLIPVAVDTILVANQGRSATKVREAFKPAKKLAEELNAEIARIVEREVEL